MRAAAQWERYGRCPVCFREWDCRRQLGNGGWGDRELRRPHKGRKIKREASK